MTWSKENQSSGLWIENVHVRQARQSIKVEVEVEVAAAKQSQLNWKENRK